MGGNINTSSSADDIKKQYFSQAKKYHPDVTQELPKSKQRKMEEKFISISKAYEILGDKKLREIYDEKRQDYMFKKGLGLASDNIPKQEDMINPQAFRKSFYRKMRKKHSKKDKENNEAYFDTDEESLQWWKMGNTNSQGFDTTNKKTMKAQKKWREKVKQSRPYSAWAEEENHQAMLRQNVITRQQRQSVLSMLSMIGCVLFGIYLFAPKLDSRYLPSKDSDNNMYQIDRIKHLWYVCQSQIYDIFHGDTYTDVRGTTKFNVESAPPCLKNGPIQDKDDL